MYERSNIMYSRFWIVALVVTVLCNQAAIGGGIKYVQGGGGVLPADSLFVSTTIRGQVAITKTTQVFRNMYARKTTAIYVYPLHATAVLTDVRWQVRGMFGSGPWYTGTMKVTDSLRHHGNKPVNPGSKINLLRYFDDAPYILSIEDTLVRGDRLVIELTYAEVLPYEADRIVYRYTPYYDWDTPTVTINRWDVDIKSSTEIRDLVAQQRSSFMIDQTTNHVQMRGVKLTSTDNIFTISYRPEYLEGSMNVLSAKQPNEDGYAIMTAVPKSVDTCSRDLPNRITFVIDRSTTMNSERLRFARLAAEATIRKLQADDVFNIVHFDSTHSAWRYTHVPATSSNVDSAIQYVRRLPGSSGANVMSAITHALASHVADEYVNSVVVLTDGETPIDYPLLDAANRSRSRLFVMGTGPGLNRWVLRRIVRDHNGAAIIIERDTHFEWAASTLYDMLRDPIMKNTQIRCGPQEMNSEWYPSPELDVYQGQQVLTIGRYKEPGPVHVLISGQNRDGQITYDYTAHLSDSTDMLDAIRVLWAKYRIDMLVRWIRIEPEQSLRSDEWYEEVVRLGMLYGINTPYTFRVDNRTADVATSLHTDSDHTLPDLTCSISPNPTSEQTAIGIEIPNHQTQQLRVEVIDTHGNIIKTLYNQPADTSKIQLLWDTQNLHGVPVTSGIYQLRVTRDKDISTTNIVVAR